MRIGRFATTGLLLAFSIGMALAQDAPYVKPVTDYALENVKPWLSEPIVVKAINAQNVETAKLKDIEINRLDIGWMDRSNKQLIDSKMNNELAAFLRKKKEVGNGVIHEIFIFDNRGLNVAQTDLTQDYNQGDEAKYWKTFQVGPDAIFVDKVDAKNVAQVSLTIKDPATGKAIGAVTVGIHIDKLPK
jgi:hypothetical protein